MPATSKSRGSWDEEMSSYATLWEWAVVRMALDHFFKDVVEGNVPLTNDGSEWWERRVVHSQVTPYHKNWALLFEGLANARGRLDGNVPHSTVQISEALEFTYDDRRNGTVPITWRSDHD